MTSSLPLICDVIFCLVVLIMVIRGWKEGFAGMLIQMLTGLLAILAAIILTPYLVNFLDNLGLTAKISAKIASVLDLDRLIPDTLIGAGEGNNIIQKLPLPEILKERLALSNVAESYEALGVSTFGEYLSVSLAQIILRGLSILVLFIVFCMIFSWLGSKLKFVNKIPLVGLINSILGGASGLVLSLILLYMIIFVITAAAPLIKPFAQISSAMEESTVVSWMVANNFGLNHLLDLFR